MYQLNLVLHSLPKSLNSKLQWGSKWKNQSENKMFDILIAGMCRNKLPPIPLKKASIRITRHFWRTLDYDGLVGSMKPIVDALVDCGVLSDDSWEVTGRWFVNQTFRPKKDGPLLEITIEERSE